MATLELDSVTTSYGKVTAVSDLQLTVGDGEFFVILGPSGAGKTTTLKSVAGLVELDSGDVSIGGRSMDGVEPYHRNVAMAFESYALYPQKTVFENIASPLRSGRTGDYSKSDQERRVELVTTTLGIDHLLKRFPRELSNGQRQRVALGRVLVRPADVYLLDEPLSHLDAKLRAAMRAELKQLGEMSNTTTLYVTHDYQEALALGDRIAVLRKGKLVQVGTPEQIWREPVDTFVAKALGQPEINLIDAEVADGRIRALDGALDAAVPSGLGVGSGGRIRLGVRPRDLEVAREGRGGSDWLRVSGRVDLAERLGRHVELSVRVGRGELIVLGSSEYSGAEGQAMNLQVPLADVHVFEAGAADEDTRRLGALGVRNEATDAHRPAPAEPTRSI
jgi:multiple sugar transport system ATP-binding protein